MATIDVASAEGHLGDCDINTESPFPEFRLYKPHTGICLECPDKQFNVCGVVSSFPS